ncbi:DUF188 domain-containing protein [Natroniella sulfidigena]|uniref:YaiI/YqxD family protein n=1 Tax=Natroniella sulfidigena TaxID=723921 RepID=UPI00200B81FF|nr:DUF188 domain-containing protein [Natroniella sulfidigena]MCK8815946.1 DUF188 domain-containing protein [Natroniella sulfidigena]
MRILIDGDSCPVKEEICKIAKTYKIEVLIFSSTAHYTDNRLEAKYITVDSNYQAVDLELVQQLTKQDLVVTNDYGLAALVLGFDAAAISIYGKVFTEKNIDYLLSRNHFMGRLRRQKKYISKASKYTKEKRERFKESLIKLIENKSNI